jgi:hypothetical protein
MSHATQLYQVRADIAIRRHWHLVYESMEMLGIISALR